MDALRQMAIRKRIVPIEKEKFKQQTVESTQGDSEFSNAVEVTTSDAEGGGGGTCFIDTVFPDALNSDAR